jgi:hypothetical protein
MVYGDREAIDGLALLSRSWYAGIASARDQPRKHVLVERLREHYRSECDLAPNAQISGVTKWRGPCASKGRDTSPRPSASHC